MITEVAITGLTKAMEGLKNSIESAFDFAQRAEKSSMALGLSYEQATGRLGGTMNGLRGDLNERFAGAVAGLEAGLQGNTAGIARLVNQQRLTGTASAKTAEAFAKLEMVVGVSRDATNKLADDMRDLSDEFTISTDNLVGALNAMAASFPAQKLAGMGAEVNAAFVGLQAELGPAMSGSLNSVMKMIMDTSMKGYENLTKLGIGNVREQLAAAKSQEEAQTILKNAIAIAAANFKSVVGDASKGFFQIGIAADIFGQSALDIVAVQDAFGQRTKEEADKAAEFGNQLNVIKSEILLPLQEAFLEFFPVIKEAAIIISGVLREAIEFLTMQLIRVYVNFGGLEGIVPKVKEKFEELKKYVTEKLIPEFKKFKDVSLAGLGIAIGLVTFKLTIMAVTAIAPVIFGLIGMAVALLPFKLIVVAVVAVVAGLVALFVKWESVVSFVKGALLDFAAFVGRMVSSLGEKLGIFGGAVTSIGDAIQEAADNLRDKPKDDFVDGMTGADNKNAAAKNAEAAQAAKDREEKRKTDEQVLNEFDKMAERDRKTFGFQERTAKNTEEINRKTAEIETSPEFLDATANMLGRSIEAILGIGADETQAEMLERMTTIAQATTAMAEKEGSGDGQIKTQ